MSLRNIAFSALLAICMGAAPTSQPTPAPDGATALEVRATTAFNRGQYATALPLLEKLQIQTSETDKSGLIAEQIRVCKAQIASAPPALANQGPNIATSAEQRKRHDPPRDGETRDMEIRELGNFDYDTDKGGNIPADVKALSGMKIRLRGFMIPMDQADKITQFALVPSLFACCYGQPPQVQHTIVCATPKGKSVTYYPDEIQVEGTLKVQEKKDEGFIVSIFEMEVSSVKPAVK